MFDRIRYSPKLGGRGDGPTKAVGVLFGGGSCNKEVMTSLN